MLICLLRFKSLEVHVFVLMAYVIVLLDYFNTCKGRDIALFTAKDLNRVPLHDQFAVASKPEELAAIYAGCLWTFSKRKGVLRTTL